jgi:hypothetical protein
MPHGAVSESLCGELRCMPGRRVALAPASPFGVHHFERIHQRLQVHGSTREGGEQLEALHAPHPGRRLGDHLVAPRRAPQEGRLADHVSWPDPDFAVRLQHHAGLSLLHHEQVGVPGVSVEQDRALIHLHYAAERGEHRTDRCWQRGHPGGGTRSLAGHFVDS